MRRAVELNLPPGDIRQAIIAFAGPDQPDSAWITRRGRATLKEIGVELGVLYETDLPGVDTESITSAPLAHPCAADVRMTEAEWEPRADTLDAFMVWFQSVNWPFIGEIEAIELLRQKLCEYEQIPPDQCQ